MNLWFFSDLVAGTKLYAKKFNDIWYKGTLNEILNKDKPRNEVEVVFNQFFISSFLDLYNWQNIAKHHVYQKI